MSRNCRRCGNVFESDRDWHRYCWECYWKLRDAGRFTSSSSTNGGSSSWRQPPPGWEEEKPPASEPPRPTVELDPRLLRDAITLTHPDRHPPERAGKANAVTAALLELLKTTRSASR